MANYCVILGPKLRSRFLDYTKAHFNRIGSSKRAYCEPKWSICGSHADDLGNSSYRVRWETGPGKHCPKWNCINWSIYQNIKQIFEYSTSSQPLFCLNRRVNIQLGWTFTQLIFSTSCINWSCSNHWHKDQNYRLSGSQVLLERFK